MLETSYEKSYHGYKTSTNGETAPRHQYFHPSVTEY